MIWSFFFKVPATVEPQRMSHAMRALRDLSLSGGLWLTCLAGIAFGVVDVLAPLRLNHLGAGAITISAAFLGAAAVETSLSPVVGRLADRLGRRRPACFSLTGSAVLALLLPTVAPAAVLVALIVGGLWFAGTLFVPAAAMVSDGSERQELAFGIGFGLTNLAWASGQGVAALGAGALAQATSDLVPYSLLCAACAATLLGAVLLGGQRRTRQVQPNEMCSGGS
jgi:MFS family permease